SIKEPEDAIRVLIARVMRTEEHQEDIVELFSRFARVDAGPDTAKSIASGMAPARAKIRSAGLPFDVATDLALSAAQYSREGSDETGWVVRMSYLGQGSGDGDGNQTCF